MASEPWYSIGPLDVFPEEFPPFLFADAGQRRLFDELHGELYNADYWKGLQDAIRAGKVIDVFPYRRKDPCNAFSPCEGLLANAVCQSQMDQLNHRIREQARSHILVRFAPVEAQPSASSAAFLPHLPAVHK